ncbi:MAG: Bug family tripartite tricarboxylate transporter substrate binding protein [Burkholderiales bacterium]
MSRIACAGIALAVTLIASVNVFAQGYPSKPVRLVVPTGPGSISDTVTRQVAQSLTTLLGQTFLVENRVGANGIIGADAVAKAPGDGYTILMGNFSTHAANPALYAKLPYDPVRDFTPIAQTGRIPYVLIVNPNVKAADFAGLVALAKAQPGKLTYATGSAPSIVGMESIKRAAGIDILQVPYKTVPQAVPDVIAGQVDMIVADLGTTGTHIRSGKLRAIATVTTARTPLLPDVPAIGELGISGLDVVGWLGWFATAGTPKDAIDRLHAALLQVLAPKDLREKGALLGIEVMTTSPAELAAFTTEQLSLWGRLIKEAGIKAE